MLSSCEYLDVQPFRLFLLGFFDRLVESELDLLRLCGISALTLVVLDRDRGCAVQGVRRCDLCAHVVVFEVDPKAVPQGREGGSLFAEIFEGQPPLGGELLHQCVGDFLRLDRHLFHEMGVSGVEVQIM